MSLLSDTKNYCSAYSLKPRRERGQNFLINPLIYRQIIEAADIQRDDTVLEIGPGLGYLTELLAERSGRVVAVEIDKNLLTILRQKFTYSKNIELVGDDALKINLEKLKLKNYKLVANLPYNITGAILRKFLDSDRKPKSLILMLQKEVAQRIISLPPKENLLSLMVQFYGRPKIVKIVSKNNFWPKPKIDSAIIKITTTNQESNTLVRPVCWTNGSRTNRQIDKKKFFSLLRAGFCSPRKYLISNLIKQEIFSRTDGESVWRELKFNPKVRAQELSLEQWEKLFKLSLLL
ncbi:MAG: 16S rRNA (adenine(1518)-N(6)/adenine(1519)-N(6))-dimethyltransferase RsmA [Patescibacteria group bacterium]|nr:16S rRNA (adenine(1518)-N(6)/adenine(1519)-N(6))-dimethyltransferase RsmA [Patescibacteria group bacterium]MDD5121631.1 16S rRNA (adenine(1518)-N(6)/adenine(1519)-N(6))-dimethyltransferase RsmA [Patescibacteria group bacterium]MDD5396205.1 16S rRNA (adenine(1518)-N(6)/adenine(1519)-N(6))-dimethyltransferase RsmA [Patescibacteria group bacterium]